MQFFNDTGLELQWLPPHPAFLFGFLGMHTCKSNIWETWTQDSELKSSLGYIMIPCIPSIMWNFYLEKWLIVASSQGSGRLCNIPSGSMTNSMNWTVWLLPSLLSRPQPLFLLIRDTWAIVMSFSLWQPGPRTSGFTGRLQDDGGIAL